MQVLEFTSSIPDLYPPEGDDCMVATNKERLDGIESRLGNIDSRLDKIDITLGINPPVPKGVAAQFWEHLWTKAKSNWKTVLPVVAILVAVSGWFISGWFKYYLDHRYDFIDGMITKNLETKGGIQDTLNTIRDTVNQTKTTLDDLKPFIHDIINHQFENTSKLPTAVLEKRLPAIKDLLAIARDQRVQVDDKILFSIGKKLASIAPTNDDAWAALQSLVSYKSLLIGEAVPQFTRAELTEASRQYQLALVVAPTADNPKGLLRAANVVISNEPAPPQDSARLERVGPYVQPNGSGRKWIILEDPLDEIVLDDIYAKNVIFKNVTFLYTGKPIRLENVYFENCKFKFANNEDGRNVLMAVSNQPTTIEIKKSGKG